MSEVFLDSSLWIAALVSREAGHERARSLYRDTAARGVAIVTTSHVVAEVHAMVGRRLGSKAGIEFLELALGSGSHRVVHAGEDIITEAIERWVRRFDDHSISLCDAISFEVMRKERISRALTMDHHFAIAGFDILS